MLSVPWKPLLNRVRPYLRWSPGSVFLPALLGLLAGLWTSQLFFLLRECRTVSKHLESDFEIILFLKDPVSPARIKTLQEQLQNHPWVSEVHFMDKPAALEQFEEAHPDLKESVLFIGENPLPASLHLRPNLDGMKKIHLWTQEFGALPEVEQVQYKSQQAKAILQLQLYIHSTQVILLSCSCILVLGGFVSLWNLYRSENLIQGLCQRVHRSLVSALGAWTGFALCQWSTAFIALSNALPWTDYSPLVLAAGGLLGWMTGLERETKNSEKPRNSAGGGKKRHKAIESLSEMQNVTEV